MKNLLLIFTLLFSSVFLSSPSYAEWTKVVEVQGNTFYVDFEIIRKHDGFVYWWELGDYLKPQMGYLSAKSYNQGDCELFRLKVLSYSWHKEPMGGGTGDTLPVPEKHKGWKYPPPNSSMETTLKSVCDR
jgi:hypothetical protein